MMSCVLIALMTAFTASQDSTPAKDRSTYIITTPAGKLPVFWDEAKKQDPDWVRVEVDEPWAPRVWQGKRSSVTDERRERKAARDERIKKGYEQHGYVEVNGRFVSQAEVALAERAFKMAGLTPPSSDAVSLAPETMDAAAPAPDPAPETAPPGFIKRWAPHAGIVAVAVLLLALISRTLLA